MQFIKYFIITSAIHFSYVNWDSALAYLRCGENSLYEYDDSSVLAKTETFLKENLEH